LRHRRVPPLLSFDQMRDECTNVLHPLALFCDAAAWV
jgi:hypothetical protein